MIHREPAGQRYLFWATYYGGDPAQRDKLRWVAYEIPGSAQGGYMRHEDDEFGVLFRYDREAADRGVRPAGARLDQHGVWRKDDAPDRNVWLGSDYGDPITTAQATEIVAELGYAPEILTADVVDL